MAGVERWEDPQPEKETRARMWALWGLNCIKWRSPREFIKRHMMDKRSFSTVGKEWKEKQTEPGTLRSIIHLRG